MWAIGMRVVIARAYQKAQERGYNFFLVTMYNVIDKEYAWNPHSRAILGKLTGVVT